MVDIKMLNRRCTFCGDRVLLDDEDAVELIATNAWNRHAARSFFAHSSCAAQLMARGGMRPATLVGIGDGQSLEEVVADLPPSTINTKQRWLLVLTVSVLLFYVLMRGLMAIFG